MTLDHLLFLLMSLIWGMTWLATRLALAAVPPVFLGAARYVVVSAVLLIALRGVVPLLAGKLAGRVIVTGLLVNVGTYGLLYWGMQYVASGVAGVVNMSTISLFLFGFAILLGQERAGLRHLAALVLGVAGLAILFSGKASFSGSDMELWAAAAIVLGSACYALGSVLSRPLLEQVAPLQLTAAQGVAAAVGMSLLTLVLEPVSGTTFVALLSPVPFAGFLFLVVAGTFVAYTIYLRLVRDWGAPRAGLYAFVSPVVALIIGALALGEPLTWREVAGGVLMLVAAAIAVAPRRGSSSASRR